VNLREIARLPIFSPTNRTPAIVIVVEISSGVANVGPVDSAQLVARSSDEQLDQRRARLARVFAGLADALGEFMSGPLKALWKSAKAFGQLSSDADFAAAIEQLGPEQLDALQAELIQLADSDQANGQTIAKLRLELEALRNGHREPTITQHVNIHIDSGPHPALPNHPPFEGPRGMRIHSTTASSGLSSRSSVQPNRRQTRSRSSRVRSTTGSFYSSSTT
jgi:hypothetical protein